MTKLRAGLPAQQRRAATALYAPLPAAKLIKAQAAAPEDPGERSRAAARRQAVRLVSRQLNFDELLAGKAKLPPARLVAAGAK